MPMTASKSIRRLIRDWSAAILGLAAIAAAAGYFGARERGVKGYRLTLTAGSPVGVRHQIAARLAAVARGSRLGIDLVPTAGSDEAIDRVEAGAVDLALIQGGMRQRGRSHVRQVATLYVEPMHLLVRGPLRDSVTHSLAGLKGKRLNLGELGSGTHALALDVLAFAGLRPDSAGKPGDYVATTLSYADLEGADRPEALPDAIFMVSTLPSKVARHLVDRHGYRLVPLPFAEALALDGLLWGAGSSGPDRVDRLHVEEAAIPAYTYGINPGEPAERVRTLGTRLLMVAHERVDPGAIGPLIDAVYGSRFAQVAKPPLAAGLLELPPEFPPHRGMVAYLERTKPLIAGDMIDLLEKELSIAGVALGGAFCLLQWGKRWYRRRRDRGIEAYLLRAMDIEGRALRLESAAAPGLGDLLRLQADLSALKGETLRRFADGELDGEELLTGFLLYVNDARDYLNRLILHERDNLEDQAQVQGRPASEAWIDALRNSGGAPAGSDPDADGLGV